jgi:hypothetical protein
MADLIVACVRVGGICWWGGYICMYVRVYISLCGGMTAECNKAERREMESEDRMTIPVCVDCVCVYVRIYMSERVCSCICVYVSD